MMVALFQVWVEQVGWDADFAIALFFFDAQVRSGFGWHDVGGCGFWRWW